MDIFSHSSKSETLRYIEITDEQKKKIQPVKGFKSGDFVSSKYYSSHDWLDRRRDAILIYLRYISHFVYIIQGFFKIYKHFCIFMIIKLICKLFKILNKAA